MRIRIKMCGTTRKQDAEAAVGFGVDALGFIFVKKSPRYVRVDLAAALISDLPPFISTVGVFVDSSIDQVKDTIVSTGLTQVQLHGRESADYCRNLKNWNRSLTVCKAFRVGTNASVPDISSYLGSIDCLLFDTYVEGMEGGTGKTFDWELISGIRDSVPVILAGGLNPDNVAAAIRTAAPYAIDINSGVEKSLGVKDHKLLEKLVNRVRRVEIEAADSD